MLITTDKKLSDDQIRRIEKLEEQWFQELDELPPLNLEPNQLCHASNKPRIDLHRKYETLIREIINE